ncbi:MAG: hypothetical protein LQ342_002354 [Letrouitia transgressa]|nr:MAG: hypothetical protein LQ342_002354 [Letrouitia transgressa]
MKLIALVFLSLLLVSSFGIPRLLPQSLNSSQDFALPDQLDGIPYPIPGTDIVLHVARGKPIHEDAIMGMFAHALNNVADEIRKHGLYSPFEYWSTFYGDPELELYVKSFRPELQWTELRSLIMGLRTYFTRMRVWCDIDFQIYKLQKPSGQGRLQYRIHFGEEATTVKRGTNGLIAPRASSALEIVPNPLKQLNEPPNTMIYPVPHSNVVLEISFFRSMPAHTLKDLLDSAYNVVQSQIHLFGGGSGIPHGEFTWQLATGNFFYAHSEQHAMSWDTVGASLKGLDDVLVTDHHFSEARAGITLKSGEGRRLVGHAYVRRYTPSSVEQGNINEIIQVSEIKDGNHTF